MKILNVNGEQVEVKYIGFTADYNPGEDPGFGGIHNDVWASDDGRKFIHLIVSETWTEYDFEKHGIIRYDNEFLKKNSKREEFFYNIFNVSIWYCGGMFRIQLVGGWDYDEQVPEYGFGTNFVGDDYCDGYYPGFDKALQVALNSIRNSKENYKIKDIAESALARACVQFHLKHRRML